MPYLVAYDIADDRRRALVATVLLDYGQRLQESLFLCHIKEDRKAEMVQRVTEEVARDQDRVHVTPVCAGCWAGVEVLGLAERPEDPESYVR
ncbi:MAG: CRISPR-associated endonuclease Cas2 [Acidobacteriota bacterium]